MDLSLLPSSVSQYKQRTGSSSTGRSAASPSNSLNCRLVVSQKETAVGTGESGNYAGSAITNPTNARDANSIVITESEKNVSDQRDESEPSSNEATVRPKQDVTTDQTVPESGTDLSESLALKTRRRTEWTRNSFANRSKSVDRRTMEQSPDRRSNAATPALSLERDMNCRRASSMTERRTRVDESIMGGAAQVNPTFPKCGSNSLPSRWRSLSGPGNKFAERDPSFGLQRGWSIVERIEKLYSAGLCKAEGDNSVSTTSTESRQRSPGKIAGGTFPRRFSMEDCNSPVRSWMPSIWMQNEYNASNSKTLPPPKRSSSHERPIESHWQGQTWTRVKDGCEVTWRKGFVDSGTRSLDRARSKTTTAARIRAARAAAGSSSAQQSNDLSGEATASSGDPMRLRERRASGSRIESWVTPGEEKRDVYRINGALKERTGRSIQEHEESGEDTELKTNSKRGCVDDVFETSQKASLKAAERKTGKLPSASSASVKNKISQFEALTQNALSSMPRRTYSVPTLNRLDDGVKKSSSAKDIDVLRKRSEERKDGWDVGGKSFGIATKLASGRSLSMDEVGLKLGKMESGESGVANDVFDHYSKFSKTLEIRLNDRTPRNRRCAVDEPDFFRVSSPEEGTKRNGTVKDTSSSPGDSSAGEERRTSPEPSSPFNDDDKTPTNTPDHSPSPPEAQDATPTADSRNKNTFVFMHEGNSQDPSDTPPLPGPSTTSSPTSLLESWSPDVRRENSKGRKQLLDLNAWITGLNPEYKGWNYDDEDSEDDDDSTEKDEDSNYDSDSGESSVTITSSHSDRRSFSVNLADLCNFTGTEYESDNESEEWQSTGRRSASLSSDVSALSCVSMMPAEELDRLLEDVRSLGNNTLQDYNEVQVVVLHKDVGVGLGFSLAGGVDQSKPITVHKVFHSGVAAKEGSIRAGDRVLSINGTALQGTAHWEALRVLRRAKAREMGVVVLKSDDTPEPRKREVQEKNQGPPSTQCDSGQRICVQLQKNGRDLGFSLEGGVDSSEGNRPLTVQKVFLGGPDDKVCSGDEVLEIQGKSMLGMRRLEAWTLIRRLPSGPVDVVLRRHRET